MKKTRHKLTHIAAAALLAAGACTATSCSLIKKTTADTAGEPLPEAVLPQDRVQIAERHTQRTYTPAELRRGVIKGDWAIETVMGKEAKGEQAPYLKFAPDGKFYGNNGCNILNGLYTYTPEDSTVRFSDTASTMRMCAMEGITDYEVNTALDAARRYRLEAGADDRYCLTLLDAQGETVMTLMHQNFEFLDGSWRVVKIGNIPVDNPDVCLVIDTAEGRVHGNTGCNILNGDLETDMEAANSISFHAIATTRMACPEPNFQTQLIVALEESSQAKPTGADTVQLLNSSGDTVLTLQRTGK